MLTAAKRATGRVSATVPGRNTVRSTVNRVRVRRLLGKIAPVLPPPGGRDVAVLLPAARLRDLDHWRDYLHADTVHLVLDRPVPAVPTWAASVDVARTAEQAAAAIAGRAGTIELLIDLRWSEPGRSVATWVRASGLLRDGGAYVLCPPDLKPARIRDAMLTLVGVVGARMPLGPGSRAGIRTADLDPDVLDLSLVFDEGAALIKCRTRFRFLADDGIEASVRQESSVSLKVLDELRAGTLHATAPVASHGSTRPMTGLPVEMPYPRLQVRRYDGRIDFFGRTLLVAGQSILPDSHRFYRRENNVHPLHPLAFTVPGRTDVARVPAARIPRPPKLAGEYYLLDPQTTGHFGHIMTEVVPRLWGWDLAKQLYPDLKTLTMVRPGSTNDPVVEQLLTAYGIAPEDIVSVDHPVRLESVITASAMWHNFAPHFAHPDLRSIWDRIGAKLIDPSAPTFDRLFLTRRPGMYRTCHNQVEVEDLFREHGFEILRPEEYSLGVQAGIFRGAEVVAGFGGSAMFNLMYSHGLRHLIVLNQESFTARNEHLYASLLGARENWFWSMPDKLAFQSDWTFDFERNGPALKELLASL